MIKFDRIDLEPWLTIGVSYYYTEMTESSDQDIPNIPAEVEIKDISIEKGTLIELLYYVDCCDKPNGFSEFLEEKLYELND